MTQQRLSINKAAKTLGIPTMSLWNWLYRHPEIERTYEKNRILVNINDCIPYLSQHIWKPRQK